MFFFYYSTPFKKTQPFCVYFFICSAILENDYDLLINHITRNGNGYNETKITKDLPSALAIRSAIEKGKVKKVKKLVDNLILE